MRSKLTALIPCKNEALNLPDCLASVAFCDEIIVADSGSEDSSMALAKAAGARVIEREYIHSANFKNWAIPQCSHRWVLIVDADERVTPELRAEVEALLAQPEEGLADYYAIGRVNHFLGRRIHHGDWESDTVNRLFQRDRCEYPNLAVHADLIFKADLNPAGQSGRLREHFLHFTCHSMDQYLEKFGPYTSRSAEDLIGKGRRRASVLNLLFRPPLRFLQSYVLRRGILDGKAGLILAALGAYYVFMKYAKLWAILEAPEKTPLSAQSTLPPAVTAEVRSLQGATQ